MPDRRYRRRLRLRDELLLALLPTSTVLLVLLAVDTVAEQRLLFASLASSAFLIYLDPYHVANSVRTLAVAQLVDVVHPPAIGTAMSFGLRAGAASNLLLFSVAVGMTAILVALERVVIWLLARHDRAPAPRPRL